MQLPSVTYAGSQLTAKRYVDWRAQRMPTVSAVFRRQFALIENGGRAASMFCLLLTAMVLLDEVPIFDPIALSLLPNIMPVLLLTVAWPFLVWNGESPARRRYHWTMPFDSADHDFIRVLAGAVWLVILMTAALIVTYLISFLVPFWHDRIVSASWLFYLNFITAGLIVYFMVSPIPLLANHPLAALLATGAAFLVLGWINQLAGGPFSAAFNQFMNAYLGVSSALMGAWQQELTVYRYWGGTYPGYWIGATIIWLSLSGSVAYLATRRAPRS